MLLSVLGVFFTVVCAVCMAMVLLHAFHRSIGTGLMVLFLPPYLVIYGFTQFEHRLKGLILAGYACGGVLGITFRLLDLSHTMLKG
ncbi:MAG: hypothetical protein QM723_24505 [Myxococcaceae bacterium]